MVGRRLKDGEDHHLIDSAGSHLITNEVFHESGEAFKEGIKKDEGVIKHYLRHVYLVVGMVIGITSFVKLYTMSYSVLIYYEDYLDWILFQTAKRGKNIEDLSQIFYNTDKYSVEGRSN